jgi:hypothetical protein
MAFLFPTVKNTDYIIRIATKRGRSWTYGKSRRVDANHAAGRVRR